MLCNSTKYVLNIKDVEIFMKEGVLVIKYYVSCLVLFFTFAILCGMALAEDVTDEASVVAVGDNLIHPVVYNDALQQDGSFNFKHVFTY